MKAPISAGELLDAATFARVRLRTIFACRKWDPQVGDVSVLCTFPLVIEPEAWRRITAAAEAMTTEALAAERELLSRPQLMRRLGLPRAIVRRLARAGAAATQATLRVMRFDFHWTADGWRISECNADVPGGWNEASGFSALIAEQCPGHRTVGDPSGELAARVSEALPRGAAVALLHATAYTDDRQVVQHLADRLAARGLDPLLISPSQVRWVRGRARHAGRDVGAIVRFFPAEWLPNLRRTADWAAFFAPTVVPACNPASALLIQSKRLPLVWDELHTPMDTWRSHLPPTHPPLRAMSRAAGPWLLKPALGRVGDGIAMPGVVAARQCRHLRLAAACSPRHWVSQHRFDSVAIPTPLGGRHVCIGVYTVCGRAAGAYARLSASPLIDKHAMDAALLLADPVCDAQPRRAPSLAEVTHA